MGVETAIIVGASLLAGAGAGAQAYETRQAEKKQERAAEDADALLRKQEKKAAEDQVAVDMAGPTLADQARNRQRALAARNSGDVQTLKTKPLGLLGNAPGERPTLLGL